MNSIEPLGSTAVLSSCVYTRLELERIFLPVRQMLQIDRVTEINNERLTCEMDVTGHWVFPMHFPADPIFPGSLLIEAAGQAVAIWGWHAGLRGRPRLVKVDAKFEQPVLPQDQTVSFVATVRRRRIICLGQVQLSVSGRFIARIDPVVIVVSK